MRNALDNNPYEILPEEWQNKIDIKLLEEAIMKLLDADKKDTKKATTKQLAQSIALFIGLDRFTVGPSYE